MTPRILVHGIAAILTLTPAVAATFTWDGGAASDNWSLAGNWNPDGAPPDDGTADLIFNVAARLAPIVDAADPSWNILSLTFGNSSGAFVIGGADSLTIGSGGVTNNATLIQTINNNIVLAASQTWNAAGGTLAFGGTIDLNTRTLTVDGAGNTAFNMPITGAGALNKNGAGTLTLGSNTNSFSGTTTVNAGTLVLNNNSAPFAISGPLIIGDGEGGANADVVRLDAVQQISESGNVDITINSSGLLNLNGFDEAVYNIFVRGGNVTTGAGKLYIIGGVYSSGNTTGTIAGNLDLGGGTHTFSTNNGTQTIDLDISAGISNGNLITSGNGTLRFSGATENTYTGTTTVDEGVLMLSKTTANSAVKGPLVIGIVAHGANTSVVRYGGSDQFDETTPGTRITINGDGLLDMNGFSDTILDLTLNGGNLTNAGAGLIVLNGSLNSIGAATAATISGGNLLLNGATKAIAVPDGTPANDLDLNVAIAGSGIIKTGTGRMRLGKANTFTGGFNLQAGSIALADDGALGTAPATFAAGTVTVDTGDIATSTRTIGNAINVTGSVTVTTTPALGLRFTGPVSGTGSINYTGSGDLSFTGSVGTFTLNGGTFGGVVGSTLTTNAFTYNGGAFNGRLNVLGTAVFNSDFTAGNGMLISSAITLAAARTLTFNGTGLANEGTLTLSGGTLAGGGPLANNSLINGNGIIAGSGGFTNNSLITQSGGNLTLSNSGANVNNGNIDMVTGFQFRLAGANLTNSGSINLRGATLTGTGTLTNSGGGTITGRGTITAPFINGPGGSLLVSDGTTNVSQSFTNAGILRLTSFSAALVGGTITNSGVITGEGTMANPFNNAGGGEVRGESGKTLYLPGVTGPNAGRLNLLGGTLQFAQQFTNSTTGQINGHGVVNFAAGLTNSGQINFSVGLAEVFGTVNLLAGSRVITSGGGDSIFYGAVTHNGTEVRTSAGAQTVFFGLVNGAGPFTGTGTVYMEGGYSPGNSPAAVTLDTELIFGDAATLTLELGGLAAGSGYDQLVLGAGGSLVLDGALVLDLINGFTPAAGDSFAVFDFAPGQLTGGFDEILLADALPAGLSFDTTQLTTTGRIGVVPEPGAAALLLTGCAFLGLHRRSRK